MLPACPPLQPAYIIYEGSAHSHRRPLDHGRSSAKGFSAPSAAIPCRGSDSKMEARASNAAPLNPDTGAWTLHAPPRHASRRKKTATTTRRPFPGAGSSPLQSDRETAVGLRCRKANLYTPRYFSRFGPVFPRDSSGRSILFPIKEEPTILTTSSLSSKSADGKWPPWGRTIFPLARAPLSKTGLASSLRTLPHVHQVTSAPVAQDRSPTLRIGSVVTPRPPARSAGHYFREDTEESRLSSSSYSSSPLSVWVQ